MKIFNLASLIATGFICTVSCSAALGADAVSYALLDNGFRITIPKCDDSQCNLVIWEKEGQNIKFNLGSSQGKEIICPLPTGPESYLKMEFNIGNRYGPQNEYGGPAIIRIDQDNQLYTQNVEIFEGVFAVINQTKPKHVIDQSEIPAKESWGSIYDILYVNIYPTAYNQKCDDQ